MTTPSEPGGPGQEGQPKPFEPMPAAPALNEQDLAPAAVATDRPKVVGVSFILWLVLAALVLAGAVIVLALSDDQIRESARKALEQQGTKNPTDQEIKDTISFIRTFGVVYNVVFAALVIAFGFLMRAGKNWARITVIVVAAIYVVLALFGGGVSALIVVVELVIAALAAYFMYRPDAKPYFAAGKVPR